MHQEKKCFINVLCCGNLRTSTVLMKILSPEAFPGRADNLDVLEQPGCRSYKVYGKYPSGQKQEIMSQKESLLTNAGDVEMDLESIIWQRNHDELQATIMRHCGVPNFWKLQCDSNHMSTITRTGQICRSQIE